MKGQEFWDLMRSETEALVELNQGKGREYAGEADVLAFLKEQAVKFGITPAQVFAVFAAKHWEAILSHVRDPTKETSEPIEGRIRDLQLYLHLYHALIKESEVPF